MVWATHSVVVHPIGWIERPRGSAALPSSANNLTHAVHPVLRYELTVRVTQTAELSLSCAGGSASMTMNR